MTSSGVAHDSQCMVTDGISSWRWIVGGSPREIFSVQIYSGKSVKIIISPERRCNMHRCMKMVQLAVIAVWVCAHSSTDTHQIISATQLLTPTLCTCSASLV